MSTDKLPFEKLKDILDNPTNYTKEERSQAAREAIEILDLVANICHIHPYPKKEQDNEKQ